MSRNASSGVALVGLVFAVGVVRSLPREFWYAVGALLAVLVVVGVAWRAPSDGRKKLKDAADAEAKAAEVAAAASQRAEQQVQEAAVLRLRREHQAEEKRREKARKDALSPFCAHCGEKTAPVFQYQRVDGGPDRRYHDNPILCNRCFRLYKPVRPENQPEPLPNEHL